MQQMVTITSKFHRYYLRQGRLTGQIKHGSTGREYEIDLGKELKTFATKDQFKAS